MNENTTSRELSPSTDTEFQNPGPRPHVPRLSDIDPEGARNRRRQVLALFGISIVAAIVGVAGFFLFPPGDTQASIRIGHTILGVGLGTALLGIGLGAVHWAKTLMMGQETVEDRYPLKSDEETRATAVAEMELGAADANIARRPVLKGAVITAAVLAPLPAVVPLIGGLTDEWNPNVFKHTAWRNIPNGAEGRILATDPDNRPIRAADVTNGSVFHVIPHDLGDLPGEEEFLNEKAKAIVILVRMDPSEIKRVSPGREDWNYHGILAFSKVCTHVGCPVALYEQNTKHLLCPCHQSTFDLADEARVVFGPAKRPLPQLPITVNNDGYLIATSDFLEPVGPSFWNREK
ncbi:MAG TPA: Rieske 2Fe-2S domain-containing protein [Actinomycetaceae bacterium]|nr:Rieske 2Fe-2S domain-containing protein [Actinomycetaceae bacterium]